MRKIAWASEEMLIKGVCASETTQAVETVEKEEFKKRKAQERKQMECKGNVRAIFEGNTRKN